MKITFDNLDKLTDVLEQINTGAEYIPTDDDIYNYVQKDPEKYAVYLLYISTNRPKAKTKAPHTSPKNALKTMLVWIAFRARILFFAPIACATTTEQPTAKKPKMVIKSKKI